MDNGACEKSSIAIINADLKEPRLVFKPILWAPKRLPQFSLKSLKVRRANQWSNRQQDFIDTWKRSLVPWSNQVKDNVFLAFFLFYQFCSSWRTFLENVLLENLFFVLLLENFFSFCSHEEQNKDLFYQNWSKNVLRPGEHFRIRKIWLEFFRKNDNSGNSELNFCLKFSNHRYRWLVNPFGHVDSPSPEKNIGPLDERKCREMIEM